MRIIVNVIAIVECKLCTGRNGTERTSLFHNSSFVCQMQWNWTKWTSTINANAVSSVNTHHFWTDKFIAFPNGCWKIPFYSHSLARSFCRHKESTIAQHYRCIVDGQGICKNVHYRSLFYVMPKLNHNETNRTCNYMSLQFELHKTKIKYPWKLYVFRFEENRIPFGHNSQNDKNDWLYSYHYRQNRFNSRRISEKFIKAHTTNHILFRKSQQCIKIWWRCTSKLSLSRSVSSELNSFLFWRNFPLLKMKWVAGLCCTPL